MGQKVEKKVTQFVTIITTDYQSGFHYEDQVLMYLATAEGYVNVSTSRITGAQIFNYVYNYTDHLGNIRLSYTKGTGTNPPVILEENHYYPFGLKHKKYGSVDKDWVCVDEDCYEVGIDVVPPQSRKTYQYKYNGKEFQDELGLNVHDFHFRQYMQDLGRTTTLDPLAEKFYSISPYSFLNNSPLYFVDPTGMASEDWIKYRAQGNSYYTWMYDSDITTKEQAQAKGYSNVQMVAKDVLVYNDNSGEMYQLGDKATITDLYTGKDVKPNFSMEGGTFIGENNQLKTIASGLQDAGDALSLFGLGATVTGVGAPLGKTSIAVGGAMSFIGTFMELGIELYEGKLTTEKVVTKTVTNVVLPKAFKRFDKTSTQFDKALMENIFTLGDRVLDEGRNNNWEINK